MPPEVDLRIRGQFHTARDDGGAARKDLDAAIEIFEKLESRVELARVLEVRGGEEDLGRAHDLFQTCGAPGNLADLN